MNDSRRRQLVLAAGGLILVSVAIHAVIGARVLVGAATGGGGYGLLLLGGAVASLLLIVGYQRGTLAPIEAYTFGCGLMLLSLYAFVDVYAIGVLESLTGVDVHAQAHAHAGHDAHGHDHGHGHGHDHDDHSHGHDDDSHGHAHDHHRGSVLAVTAEHSRERPAAMLSKAAEAGAAVLLAGLALTDGRDRR